MIAWEDWYEVNQLQGLPWCFDARREYSEIASRFGCPYAAKRLEL